MANAETLIRFHYLITAFSFKRRKKLKAYLFNQLLEEGKQVDTINYVFCGDDYLANINRQYLSHDTLTDIVTFELSTKDAPLLADIYISIDRIRDNAAAFSTKFDDELHRVIFHGVLHLCGYKDKTKTQAELMRQMEQKWLDGYFVSREIPQHKD